MKNIAELLLEYWNTADKSVLGIHQEIKKADLDAIVLGLLSWLRLERKREIWIEQGRKTKLKDMELFSDAPWCCELIELSQGDNALAQVFSTKGNRLNFRDDISIEYRKEARDLAYSKYNPPMIIS